MLKSVYNGSVRNKYGVKVKRPRRQRLLFIGLFVSTLILLSAAGRGQEQDSAVGELKLEGQGIEKLVLWSGGGSRKEFNRPGESLTLPVGTYTLREVRLEGGYVSDVRQPFTVTVTTDKPAVLKVGAPLSQTVRAQRQGRVLALDYELAGTGGEKYRAGNRGEPPRFAVYKGDEEIASGRFEYG